VGSFLCGVDKVMADALAYNEANAPKKYQAVVNLSLGLNGRSDIIDAAVMRMTDNGIVVVIAAGNNDDNACFYSPYADSAITVGALANDELGQNDKTASSNYGGCIDVWAPGEDVYGSSNTGEYDSVLKSGTSVAAALATGTAALFYEELNTDLYTIDQYALIVQQKLTYKAEINILREIGHNSHNRVLQTTAVKCLQDSHCQPGLVCLRDGMCVVRSDLYSSTATLM